MGKVSLKNFNNSGSNLIKITAAVLLVVALTTNPETPKKASSHDTFIIHPVEQLVLNEVKEVEVKETPSVGTGELVWPAQGGYISSEKGPRWGTEHKGIDIAQPDDFDIVAADHGVIKAAGEDGTFGNRVIIDHNNGYETIYAHLDSIDVKVGDKVAQDTKIGVMGTTGSSTGIHLHFEVSHNGVVENPLDYISE